MRRWFDKTYYIGLCVTYHDPALALVGPDGSVRHAEATERPLQNKRALDCVPDQPHLLPGLLAEHCGDAGEFVIATNWRTRRPGWEHLARWLGWLSPRGILTREGRRLHAWVPMYQLHHMQAAQHHAIRRRAIHLARILRQHYPDVPVRFQDYDHHLSHAAFACFGSPYDEALCAVIDSYGEEGSMAFYRWSGGRLDAIARSKGPQSLGFYYMKLTELCGFDWVGGEEWKVMGLASYGHSDPALLACLRGMSQVDGLSVRTDYPGFRRGLPELDKHRRAPTSDPEVAANLAQTGQQFFVETVNQLLNGLHRQGSTTNLAFAGGCALNSSCNGQILGNTPFESLHVPSAPADDGCAIGAAWLAWSSDHGRPPDFAKPLSAYLGSSMDCSSVHRFARYANLPAMVCEGEELVNRAARLLADGKIIGWVQGRAEFGPRALGSRSILADPRSSEMAERLNREVKFRERFRPFAPAILHEFGPDYFEDYQDSPYMERTLRFRPDVRERVPAVVHVDGTGRLQSVTAERNGRFHALLARFHELTGVPILLNTSFNVMGKPIVHAVEDAFAVFMGSGLDALVIGDVLFQKPPARH